MKDKDRLSEFKEWIEECLVVGVRNEDKQWLLDHRISVPSHLRVNR